MFEYRQAELFEEFPGLSTVGLRWRRNSREQNTVSVGTDRIQSLHGQLKCLDRQWIWSTWNDQKVTAQSKLLQVLFIWPGSGINNNILVPRYRDGRLSLVTYGKWQLAGPPPIGHGTIRIPINQKSCIDLLEIGGTVNGSRRLGYPTFEACNGYYHARQSTTRTYVLLKLNTQVPTLLLVVPPYASTYVATC